jgi:Glycosyl-4,4'-diaponeurosporenoate acyltransferase
VSARRHLLNALPNVLWTALFLGPVYVFCARYVSLKYICIFLVAGAVALSLPRSALQRFRLSSNVGAYRRLRVPLLVGITQDAAWIRRLSGHSEARVRSDRKTIARLTSDAWMRERFHLGAFLYCTLCAVVALCQRRLLWFSALLLINTFYNLYPMWVQQYLRIRVARLLRHASVQE